MKKNILLLLFLVAAASMLAAQDIIENPTPEEAADMGNSLTAVVVLGKNYVRAGVLETIKNELYILKQKNTKIEFSVSDATKIYMTEKVVFNKVGLGNYLLIRGPKNRNVVLSNSINIYTDKKAYVGNAGADEGQAKEDALLVKGVVTQVDPMIITTDDNMPYRVEHDEDSYWVLNKDVAKADLRIGDRLVIYFEKMVSIRYVNSPVKILIKRAP
ncbi:MAG: hypothetical protein WCJ46_00320 [bacterium]